MSGVAALLLCMVAIAGLILTLRRLARPHALMYVEISRHCADIQARAALRAAAYDQTPVPHPSVDGPAARAGTPDPARAVTPQRVHIEMGGRGRHREAA